MKQIKNSIEYAIVALLLTAFRCLPLDVASAFGGWMARAIGPFLPVHHVAIENLKRVYPDITTPETRKILTGMWDNLGRNIGELPHLPGNHLINRFTLDGAEHFPGRDKQVMMFSAHMGNWELTYPSAKKHDTPLALAYRKANNPLVDKLINNIRMSHATQLFAKGPTGAVSLVRNIKSGRSIAMLVDQKMNDGIAVPFFGQDVMTAPAIAEIALRYNLPIVPARVVRTKGCHFNIAVYPPMDITPTGDKDKDVLAIMTEINAILESWIREYPEQWFWVHKRWPKET